MYIVATQYETIFPNVSTYMYMYMYMYIRQFQCVGFELVWVINGVSAGVGNILSMMRHTIKVYTNTC